MATIPSKFSIDSQAPKAGECHRIASMSNGLLVSGDEGETTVTSAYVSNGSHVTDETFATSSLAVFSPAHLEDTRQKDFQGMSTW